LTDITKLLSDGWKELSEIERQPYVDLADADQLRYKGLCEIIPFA
jgi:hypothetical protein